MKARVLAAIAGACLGLAIHHCIAGLLPETDENWDYRGSPVVYELADTQGTLRPDPAALDLWGYRSAAPQTRLERGTIVIDATIPEGGQLQVKLGARAMSGPVAPEKGSKGTQGGPADGRAGVPPDAGRGPQGGPGGPSGPADGGVAEGGVVVIDRTGGQNAVHGIGTMTCGENTFEASDEDLDIVLDVQNMNIAVEVDGERVATCAGNWRPGPVALSSGVRRIQISRVELSQNGSVIFEDDFGGAFRGWLGVLLSALAGAAVLGFAVRGRAWLATLPLLAVPLLFFAPIRGWLDALRMLSVADPVGPLLFAGVPALLAGLVVIAKRRPIWVAVPVGGLPALGLLLACLAFDEHAGWAAIALACVPWTALAWVNTHPVKWRPALSYGLLFLVIGVGEWGVRWTPLDSTWQRTDGWLRASLEFKELVELQQYRSYPMDGFPVRPPEPSDTPRIVALGGSSTGGAYQMDDIELFWPRRLQDELEGWEVVNQGVGGWNSLHVRLYVESQIERLEPEILALYIGHNDILHFTAAPYSELYANWQPGMEQGSRPLSDLLHRSRMFVGFKFAVLSLGRGDRGEAVPVNDAEDNFLAILDAARSVDARVLLMTEGLNPDPLPMGEYGAMQAEIAAENEDVIYFDAATALHREHDPDLYLDDCHLSEAGHIRLAEMIAAELDSAGW